MVFGCKARSLLLLLFAVAQLCQAKSIDHGRQHWPAKVVDSMHGDHYLVGDMMLSEEQASGLFERSMIAKQSLWPRNKDNEMVISYAWDPKPDKPYYKATYTKGMDILQDNTCVVFKEIPLAKEFKKDPPFMLLSAWKSGCASHIGITSIGPRWVSVSSYCSVGAAAHELSHALGTYHTQSRSDRDHHVKVLYDNMMADGRWNYYKANTDNYGVPYDISSGMHYNAWNNRLNMSYTMIPLDPRYLWLTGVTDGMLSFMDFKLLNTAYKCVDDWKEECNGDPCKNGGFIRNKAGSCKCVCPDGTKGDKCETLEMSYNEARNKQFNPLSEKITKPGTIGTQKAFTKEFHTKWIVAPKCKRAVLTFTLFELGNERKTSGNCKDEFWIELGDEIGKGEFYCGTMINKGQKFVSEKSEIRLHLWTYGKAKGYSADVTFEDIPNCS